MNEPPMDTDPMGGPDMGPDPMGGPDMGPDPMDGSDDMTPMDGPDDGGDSDDQELLDIINDLSIEDKAAVTKYAKSMADRSGGNNGGKNNAPDDLDDFGGAPDGGSPDEVGAPPMPMEARRRINSMISEITNELQDGERHTKRNRKYVDNKKAKNSPFVSKR